MEKYIWENENLKKKKKIFKIVNLKNTFHIKYLS